MVMIPGLSPSRLGRCGSRRKEAEGFHFVSSASRKQRQRQRQREIPREKRDRQTDRDRQTKTETDRERQRKLHTAFALESQHLLDREPASC